MRQCEKIVNQASHLFAAFSNPFQIFLAFLGKLRTEVFQNDASESIYRSQRCAQIVGDGITERLEFLVGSFELRCALNHSLLERTMHFPQRFFRSPALGGINPPNTPTGAA